MYVKVIYCCESQQEYDDLRARLVGAPLGYTRTDNDQEKTVTLDKNDPVDVNE